MGDSNENSGDPWVPKSRQEWAEVFAEGLGLHRSKVAEEEAKKKADESSKNGGEEGNGDGNGNSSGDSGPPKRRTLGDIILGNP